MTRSSIANQGLRSGSRSAVASLGYRGFFVLPPGNPIAVGLPKLTALLLGVPGLGIDEIVLPRVGTFLVDAPDLLADEVMLPRMANAIVLLEVMMEPEDVL